MLNPLRLRMVRGANYKAFEGSFELELAPLTVIFGRNGSGKTALLRLPLALCGALAGGDSPGLPLRVRGLLLGNSLASFVHGGAADKYELGVEVDRGGRIHTLDVVVRRDPKTSLRLPGQWIERWSLRDETRALACFKWDASNQCYVDGGSPAEDVTTQLVPATFKGLVPVLADGSTHPVFNVLRPAPRVVHLSAARGVPGEDFVPEQPNVTLDVESDGAATRRVLGALRGLTQGQTLDRVIKGVRSSFDVELRVEEIAQGAVQGTILQAKPCRRSTWLSIAELGTGLSHALPLFVQYALAARGADGGMSVLLCEEPEAHTHPEVHACLADFIADAVLEGQFSTVVETHSETFVLRIRRRVAEGKLRPEQVAFYWVDDEQDATTLRRVHMDVRGRLKDWPEGWFDAPLNEVLEMQRATGTP